MKRYIAAGAANLFPAYFALVMATGIIAIAAHRLGLLTIAWALLAVAVAAYVVLWLLTLLRLLWFLPNVLTDVANHARGPGFFTLVAGSCVLGSALLIIAEAFQAARLLWVLGIALWLLVTYSFFTVATVREQKPTLASGINGAWLLAVVATQSIAVLGTLILPRFAAGREIGLFFTLCMYLIGCMLYLSIITLIFYRLTFVHVTSAELTPPYWINMGAVAITTLAGANLIRATPHWPFLTEILPFLKGFTLFFWSAGTWWIPLLLILGVWRHLVKRHPLTYEPSYWGMVFPLGMYTVSTFQFAQAIQLDFLLVIPHVFIWIALAAWLATFVGLLRQLASSMARSVQTAGSGLSDNTGPEPS
jgi:tellurite resistance protein TehA-like permease